MKYQDIQIDDKNYWRLWKNSFNGSNAVNNAYLKKATIASTFNELTSFLTDLMSIQPDPSFKADVIKTSENPPAGLESGKVYFQLIIPAFSD